mgnify:CR=1 FL=1
MTTQIHLSEDIGIRHIVNNVDGIKHNCIQPSRPNKVVLKTEDKRMINSSEVTLTRL